MTVWWVFDECLMCFDEWWKFHELVMTDDCLMSVWCVLMSKEVFDECPSAVFEQISHCWRRLERGRRCRGSCGAEAYTRHLENSFLPAASTTHAHTRRHTDRQTNRHKHRPLSLTHTHRPSHAQMGHTHICTVTHIDCLCCPVVHSLDG